MKNTDKKVVITNWFNYKPAKPHKNNGISETVPDQSFTIPEILEKFTRGISLNIQREGQYTDPEGFEDIDGRQLVKDYADIDQVTTHLAERRKVKAVKKSELEAEQTATKETVTEAEKTD